MSRIYAIPMTEDTNYRIHRNDVQALCQDVIESLILDLFDYWTTNQNDYKEGSLEIIWLKESGEDVKKGLKIEKITTRTIQSKLKSLIDKKLLLTKRDKQTRNPNKKLYALNLPYLKQKINDIHARPYKKISHDPTKKTVKSRAKNPVKNNGVNEKISQDATKKFHTTYITNDL